MSKNRINDNKPVREMKKKIGSVSIPKKKRNDKNNTDRQAEAARHDRQNDRKQPQEHTDDRISEKRLQDKLVTGGDKKQGVKRQTEKKNSDRISKKLERKLRSRVRPQNAKKQSAKNTDFPKNETAASEQEFGGSRRNEGRTRTGKGNGNDRQQNSQWRQIKKADGLYVPPVSGKKIRVIPLGGLEQIGMNITVIESENSIVIVDCGMAFPNEEMLGIDLVIPDITYLRENADKIEGFFITHGHEDHIGALPYILRELNVPVFSTRLTRALIENKLREHGLIESAKLNTVSFGDFVSAGDFSVEFIKTNHSIQDAAALAIHSPAGVILHTGDFKVDYTPVFGDTIDLQRFAELGKQGVLALLCDSTNAARQGFTMSERTVGHTFDTIFNENKENRIIVATFASNVDRVQQVITTAEKYGRKVIIDGRSMINIIGAASELGYIRIREGTLLDISEIKNYPDDKIVLIVTGSQGESMAALSRMATGQHRKISLSSNDVIVLSSTPIPGNEKAVSKVINELSRRRTKVIYQDTHVSGHACAEELKLIYALVRPRFSIPVHGELRHRLAQKEVAVAVGMPKENCFLIDTGDVAELSQDSCRVIDKVQAGPVMVDGLGVGDVGNVVLKDRQSLSQNGIMIVSLAIEKHSAQIIAGPEIVTRGLIYVKENEEIIEEARNVVLKAIDECRKYKDMARVRNTIRNELSDYIWRRMKRTPIILPVISEV